MKKLIPAFLMLMLWAGVSSCSPGEGPDGPTPPTPGDTVAQKIKFTHEELLDKIKGGWAGQTIGCSYGAETEFRYQGVMIPDDVVMKWSDDVIEGYYNTWPELYDDIYMDLTFVDVFDKKGLDATANDFALAFANAPYPLWHGNQAARYNILRGIMPPESGHWLNSPHCDDLDFQIEADFAGLMSPGMPNTASEISDKVGHIMSYGEGWYGGVYVSAMYSLAFVEKDAYSIVSKAQKVLPPNSLLYSCVSDLIRTWQGNPGDWKLAWQQCEEMWNRDVACPDGVLQNFNIDALLNCAYVVIGLLYGENDYFKTLDISTRCGQDSDCNPATAGGILATMMGYSKLEEKWMRPLRKVEDRNFVYTEMSLNKTYDMSYRQALEVIKRNGGEVTDEGVTITVQKPKAVRYERAFEGHYPSRRIDVSKDVREVGTFTFEGIGIAFRGGIIEGGNDSYVAEIEVYLDGEKVELAKCPASFHSRRLDLFWRYQLEKGSHTVSFNWLNPKPGVKFIVEQAITYSDKP